jgi:hypothetical protein
VAAAAAAAARGTAAAAPSHQRRRCTHHYCALCARVIAVTHHWQYKVRQTTTMQMCFPAAVFAVVVVASRRGCCLLLSLLLLLAAVGSSRKGTTGKRPTKPALGFNHCSIECCGSDMPNASFLMGTADAMVQRGLKAAGYMFVNLVREGHLCARGKCRTYMYRIGIHAAELHLFLSGDAGIIVADPAPLLPLLLMYAFATPTGRLLDDAR